jgi:para-nitrobenzyl esterase
VVTLNHRLGVLGYLQSREHDQSDYSESGNVGLLDIVEALRWVRENIHVFGGDPDNVTIFGQSGGGAKVSSLLAMTGARGLFHRAITQSGVDLWIRTMEEARQQTKALFKELGLESCGIANLAKIPVHRLLRAATVVESQSTPGSAFRPVMDGAHFQDHPINAVAGGSSSQVPLVIGTTADETSILLPFDAATKSLCHSGLLESLKDILGDQSSDIIESYRTTHSGMSDADLYVAITTDRVRVPAIWFAEAKEKGGVAPVFMYKVAYHHPAANGVYRAVHGVDWPLVFDTCHASPAMSCSTTANALAAQMSAIWANFARNGEPTTRTAEWPPFGPCNRHTKIFDTACRIESSPLSAELDVWQPALLRTAGLVSRTPLPVDTS